MRRPNPNDRASIAMWLLVAALLSQPAIVLAETSREEAIDFDLYSQLLESHTKPVADLVGVRVDYRSLEKSTDWSRLVDQVRAAKPTGLSREARLAYWINAYNILTIDLVLAHYPVDSIRDIGSFFSPVWKIPVATIEGRELSLGEIEHEILRPMGEPRIHAAIVCASTSCPPLARSPFRANTIDADLDRAMRVFLASDRKGIAIDREANSIRVSKIFDWFEEDFEVTGGIRKTISKFLAPVDRKWLVGKGRNASIRFFDYDWSLNDDDGKD